MKDTPMLSDIIFDAVNDMREDMANSPDYWSHFHEERTALETRFNALVIEMETFAQELARPPTPAQSARARARRR